MDIERDRIIAGLRTPSAHRAGPEGAPNALALRPADAAALMLFLAAIFALRVIGMFFMPFTDTTEARYAEIARKMLETGDWITPQFAYGVPFWGKPPLHTWLSAAGMGMFGVDEFGGRILIFALACGLLALFYRWLVALRGAGFALAATAVLASSALYWVASAFVMTDLAMAAGTSLSMIGFWNIATRDRRAVGDGLLFFGGLAIGMLAKGPTAVMLTALPIAAWVAIGGHWGSLRRIPWARGLALTLLIVAPWYILAELKTPGFLRYFLIGEHVERFLVGGWKGDLYGQGHREPKGMIWAFWLLACLPWPLVAIRLALRAGRVRAAFRSDATGWRGYLLAWAISPMILFTPAANILIPYVLPGLPAAAVLLVQLWVDVRGPAPDATTRRWFAVAGGVTLAVYAVAAALAVAAPDVVAAPSHKALVATARLAAPDATLNVLGKRSYSAEFYTQGAAVGLPEADAIETLLANGRRDALSVETSEAAPLPAEVLARMDRIGAFGRRTLFIEHGDTSR